MAGGVADRFAVMAVLADDSRLGTPRSLPNVPMTTRVGAESLDRELLTLLAEHLASSRSTSETDDAVSVVAVGDQIDACFCLASPGGSFSTGATVHNWHSCNASSCESTSSSATSWTCSSWDRDPTSPRAARTGKGHVSPGLCREFFATRLLALRPSCYYWACHRPCRRVKPRGRWQVSNPVHASTHQDSRREPTTCVPHSTVARLPVP
jgi:hypothetical protein